jgi:phage terminase small subunit
MLELYCALRAEFRVHVRKGTEMQAARLMVMMNVAGKLGLNPSDRTKVCIAKKPQEKDEWAEFAAETNNRFARPDN